MEQPRWMGVLPGNRILSLCRAVWYKALSANNLIREKHRPRCGYRILDVFAYERVSEGVYTYRPGLSFYYVFSCNSGPTTGGFTGEHVNNSSGGHVMSRLTAAAIVSLLARTYGSFYLTGASVYMPMCKYAPLLLLFLHTSLPHSVCYWFPKGRSL